MGNNSLHVQEEWVPCRVHPLDVGDSLVAIDVGVVPWAGRDVGVVANEVFASAAEDPVFPTPWRANRWVLELRQVMAAAMLKGAGYRAIAVFDMFLI